MTFLLLDLSNTFYRARHSAHRAQSTDEKVGLAIHVTMSSIAMCWREHKADHVVIALEGRSWRKDFYQPYKRNRIEAREAATPAKQEEDRMFWDACDALSAFLRDRTNCTVLQNPQLEADDIIAGWIQSHPNDNHIIVSSDSDFVQLIAPNVKQYNGVTEELVTVDGIFDRLGRPIKDRRTGVAKPAPDPEWELFEKCVRGDATDNVFSAYPGVRTKSTKNRVGLTEAFADRHVKGWAWNNLMLTRWSDHNDQEHRVLDDYQRNRTLIDLSAQPEHIREEINKTVLRGYDEEHRSQIGSHFMKFCGKYNLQKLSDNATMWGQILSATLETKEKNDHEPNCCKD